MTPIEEPISISRLLDRAIRLVSANFKTVVLPISAPLAVAGGLLAALQASLQTRSDPTLPVAEMVLWMVSAFGWLVVLVLAYGAVFAAAVSIVLGRPLDLARAWLTLLRPKVLGTLIIVGLGMGFGCAFCLVPGIYLWLLWSVTLPVMLAEDAYGFTAMSRSAALMRYNPLGGFGNAPRLRAFVVMLSAGLLGYLLNFVVQLPLTVAMFVLMAREIAAGSPRDPQEFLGPVIWLQVPTNMLGMGVQALTQFFGALGMTLLYEDVRRRREGEDLAGAIDSLSAPRFAR